MSGVAEKAATPGPWKWFNYPDGRKLLCASNRAVIHCPDAAIGIEEEDQALIAAAPDLVSALTPADIDQIAEGIDHFVIGNNDDVAEIWQPYIDKLKALKAAILKAQVR